MSAATNTKTSKHFAQMSARTKAPGDAGDRVIRFVASTPDEDRDGDTIAQDGIRLDHFMQNPVFQWAHDYSIPPIGKVINAEIIDGKLHADVQFLDPDEFADGDPHAQFADHIYRLYQQGVLNAVSIGFIPLTAEPRDEGGLHFPAVEMLELSGVPVQSNRGALQVRDCGESVEAVRKWARRTLDDAMTKEAPAPPERFKEQLKIGLRWHEEGYSGDGLKPETVAWAGRMADGETPSEDKIKDGYAFMARHLAQDNPMRTDDGDPTPYAVAIKLWGGEDEGPPYWRRAMRAIGEEVDKGPQIKAGQTLNASNRKRARTAFKAVVELMRSGGMDPTDELKRMDGDDDKSADAHTKSPKQDTKMPTEEQIATAMNALSRAQETIEGAMELLAAEVDDEPDEPETDMSDDDTEQDMEHGDDEEDADKGSTQGKSHNSPTSGDTSDGPEPERENVRIRFPA